jgi:hypothetical protein
LCWWATNKSFLNISHRSVQNKNLTVLYEAQFQTTK